MSPEPSPAGRLGDPASFGGGAREPLSVAADSTDGPAGTAAAGWRASPGRTVPMTDGMSVGPVADPGLVGTGGTIQVDRDAVPAGAAAEVVATGAAGAGTRTAVDVGAGPAGSAGGAAPGETARPGSGTGPGRATGAGGRAAGRASRIAAGTSGGDRSTAVAAGTIPAGSGPR